MISLQNDYSEGAHPQILKRLAEINLEQNPGYCTERQKKSDRPAPVRKQIFSF